MIEQSTRAIHFYFTTHRSRTLIRVERGVADEMDLVESGVGGHVVTGRSDLHDPPWEVI